MRVSTSVPQKEQVLKFYEQSKQEFYYVNEQNNSIVAALDARKTAMGIITRIAQFGVDRFEKAMDKQSRDIINYTINRLMVSLSFEEMMIYEEPNEEEPNTFLAFLNANNPPRNAETYYCYFKQGQ